MVEEIRSFVKKTAIKFMDWVFQSELKKFDNLANELKQHHDSPSSYDIKTQITHQKEHLNGRKIVTHVNLDFNDNNEIEATGITSKYNQDESSDFQV